MYSMFFLIGISGLVGASWLLTIPVREGVEAVKKAKCWSQLVGYLILSIVVFLVIFVIVPRATNKLMK